MIEVRGYQIPNSPSEMTVGKFEGLSEIIGAKVMNPNEPNQPYKYESELEKWSEALAFMGLPMDEINDMELDEFTETVKRFNTKDPNGFQVIKEVEVKGRTYVAFKEEFRIGVAKWKKLEALVKQTKHESTTPKKIVGEILAIIFEDTMLTAKEHLVDAHLKRKANLFRKHLNAGIAVPYVAYVTQKLLQNQQAAVNEINAENGTKES